MLDMGKRSKAAAAAGVAGFEIKWIGCRAAPGGMESIPLVGEETMGVAPLTSPAPLNNADVCAEDTKPNVLVMVRNTKKT